MLKKLSLFPNLELELTHIQSPSVRTVLYLQNMTTECVEILAAVCRTISLANLHMMFPDPRYWRQKINEMPQFASNYVEDYLGKANYTTKQSSNSGERYYGQFY